MKSFDSPTDAIAAIRDFQRTPPAGISDHLAAKLREVADSMSPVVAICGVGEALYANRAELNDDAKELCAGLIAFAASFGWHGLGGTRGLGIVQAMRRDAGETSPTGKWPDAENDPAPNESYAPTPQASPQPGAIAAPTPQ